MVRRLIYETNYERLEKLGVFNMKELEDHVKIKMGGYMPFCVELINNMPEKGDAEYSLCFYGEQNGDLMRDPELIVRIFHDIKMAEATYFRNDYVGLEQYVYPEPGYVNPALKKDLNSYLRTFLEDIRKMGIKIRPEYVNVRGGVEVE